MIAQSKWNGFDIIEFQYNGIDAKIAFPQRADSQRNWLWRTQFWNDTTQVDIAMLNEGFHLAYIDVTDLYGSAVAMHRFDGFYQFVVKNFQLNTKVVFEGLSRGGLEAYNWSSKNTDKVACLYVDAPVCDIKSWPGGLGKGTGSKEEWATCLAVNGLNKESVLNFKEMPLYNCIELAKAKIPVLHVCGDSDEAVPMEENTDLLADRFRKAGGDIQIIVKKGIGHHPHSLENPQPIVDFILKHTREH